MKIFDKINNKYGNILKIGMGVATVVVTTIQIKKAIKNIGKIKNAEIEEIEIINKSSELPEETYSQIDEVNDRQTTKVKYAMIKIANWIKPVISSMSTILYVRTCINIIKQYIHNKRILKAALRKTNIVMV